MDECLLNLTPDSFCENRQEVLEAFKTDANWRSIPLLNHTKQRDMENFKIFRFRGMVQDMYDPEIYLEAYQVEKDGSSRMQNGKYRDFVVADINENVNYDSQSNVLGERRCLVVVPVPCQNKWSKDHESEITKKCSSSNKSEAKRTLENSVKMEVDSVEVLGTKKMKCEALPGGTEQSISRVVTKENAVLAATTELPTSCLVKIYDASEEHSLNSLIDAVGFLTLSSSATTLNENEDFMDTDGTSGSCCDEASLVPTLHAIAVRRIEHVNPLLDALLTDNDPFEEIDAAKIQKDLKIALTQCLFGDVDAAEYLLVNLISSIFVRTEMETLGKFCLNISNIPSQVLPDYTRSLYEIIELLVPASHYVSMTLENLNSAHFIPKKDYTTNKLKSGLLQLAPHTHLVLDETCLQAGKLESNGVEAVRNLSHLIRSQQIKCDFKFYELDFNVNVPVLIVSEGKSMLPSDCHIPLKIEAESVNLIAETLKAVKHYLQPKLAVIRKYLTWAKLREFTVDPNVTAMIESDFVKTRETNGKFGANELHKLLVLARLLGIAQGKSALDKETWELAKSKEMERLGRIK